MYVTLDPPRKPRPVDINAIKPLLDFLQSLPQLPCQDRALTWAEDSKACLVLLSLPIKPFGPHLKPMIDYYVDPQYQVSRTLAIWYQISYSVAYLIETDGECDCCAH